MKTKAFTLAEKYWKNKASKCMLGAIYPESTTVCRLLMGVNEKRLKPVSDQWRNDPAHCVSQSKAISKSDPAMNIPDISIRGNMQWRCKSTKYKYLVSVLKSLRMLNSCILYFNFATFQSQITAFQSHTFCMTLPNKTALHAAYCIGLLDSGYKYESWFFFPH